MPKVKDKSAENQTEENQAKGEKSVNTEEKSKKKKEKKEKKEKKGSLKVIIFLMFFVLIMGMAIAILFFNAFNIREKYLRSTIDKIPVVKNIIPKAKTENANEENNNTMTIKEAEAKIADLENQLATKDTTIDTLTKDNDALKLENNRLKEIESQQIEFKADKEEFDKMIAENNPEAYSAFYESISPENAEKLYQSTKATSEQTKELKKYTDTFQEIDPEAGAGVIEEMVGTDMNLASLILSNIDSEQRAKIIAAMDPTRAASVVKYMAPNTTTP